MRLTQAAARDLIGCLAMLLSASLLSCIVMPSALAQRGVNGPATENHQSGLSQSAQKRRQVGLIIFPRPAADISHHRHARLRARRERPRRRAAEQRDEFRRLITRSPRRRARAAYPAHPRPAPARL